MLSQRRELGARLCLAGIMLLVLSALTHFWWTEKHEPWSDKVGLRSTISCSSRACPTQRFDLSSNVGAFGTAAWLGTLATSGLLLVGVIAIGLRREATQIMGATIATAGLTIISGTGFIIVGASEFERYQLGASVPIFYLGAAGAIVGSILLIARRG